MKAVFQAKTIVYVEEKAVFTLYFYDFFVRKARLMKTVDGKGGTMTPPEKRVGLTRKGGHGR